jgi:hypothetical protein
MLITAMTVKAQNVVPLTFMDYMQGHTIAGSPGKKWSVSAYSGISAGYSFFNGGSASILSVPVRLQLNRRLSENLYAFGAVTAAPVYMNFSQSFITSNLNKAYPNSGLFRYNSPGIYSRAELGLMYMNDAKTFSVSGSIGLQRSSYPAYPYPPAIRERKNPALRN